MARLAHPNVVAVHDVGAMSGDLVFVAMELVEGATLRRWLKQKRSWREIVAVMGAAGTGLAAAHAAGLVHRDFKPDNVLVGNDGRARVNRHPRLAGVVDAIAAKTPVPKLPRGGIQLAWTEAKPRDHVVRHSPTRSHGGEPR